MWISRLYCYCLRLFGQKEIQRATCENREPESILSKDRFLGAVHDQRCETMRTIGVNSLMNVVDCKIIIISMFLSSVYSSIERRFFRTKERLLHELVSAFL